MTTPRCVSQTVDAGPCPATGAETNGTTISVGSSTTSRIEELAWSCRISAR